MWRQPAHSRHLLGEATNNSLRPLIRRHISGSTDRDIRGSTDSPTGLRLGCEPVLSRVAAAQSGFDVDVFAAEAESNAPLRLSAEHDRYEWVHPKDLDRYLPAWVRAMYRGVLELVGRA